MRPPALEPWFTAVSALKFVGPATTEALARLLRITREVEEAQSRPPVLRDLLFHMPVGLLDRRVITPIAGVKAGDYATLEVEILEHVPPPRTRRKIPYRVVGRDASGILILTYYHVKDNYLTRSLPVGSTRIICGTVSMVDGQASISHPDITAPSEKAQQVLKLEPAD